MSRSPVVQNGKLAGVATYILMNDPTGTTVFSSKIRCTQQNNGGRTMDFYDLPFDLGLAMAMNPSALCIYSAMTEEQKQAVLNRARSIGNRQELK